MVLDHRRIELGSTVETAQIANNSGTHGMAINTDLLVSNSGNKALGLASVAGPANVFAGLVADGSHDSATQVIRLNKSGAGTWSLANAGNSYTGATTIQQGVLSTGSIGNIGAGASALGNPGSAATGLIVLGAGNNTGTLLYTGPSQSTDRTIQVNSSTNTNTGGASITNDGSGPLTFTAATFNEAYVLASTVTRTLTLAGTNGGTVQGVVQDNSLTGKIAIAKSGAGTWLLTGTNTYTGNTTINGGALQATEGVGLPTAGILQLRGGVFQSSGTFTRPVSTAAGAVNWSTGSGGFAAKGAPLVLNLNAGTGSLTWNGNSFVSTGQTLIFGSTSADSLVDFQNSINLGSSGTNNRTITVIDNPGSATDRARISGALTNTAAGQGLIKDGDGILELTGTNTYTGPTAVSAGTLALTGGSQTSGISVVTGASIGFTLGSPTTSTAALDLTDGTVQITGTPNSPSHLLMTASTIMGMPELHVAIPGYTLVKANGDTELRLNQTGGANPYDTWSGGAAFDDDANDDGVKNGLAFLLGAPNPSADAIPLLPVTSRNGGNLVLTFKARNLASRGPATLNVEHSGDLGISDPWVASPVLDATSVIPVNGVTYTVAPGSPLNDVTAEISSSGAAAGKLFGRLKGNR